MIFFVNYMENLISFLHPANIDVNQVVPIRVMGKEGGSMRAKRSGSPQKVYQSGTEGQRENPQTWTNILKTKQEVLGTLICTKAITSMNETETVSFILS